MKRCRIIPLIPGREMIVKAEDSYGNPHAIGDLHDAALGLLRPHDQPVEQRKYITHADIRVKCHNCKTCAEKYDQTDKGSLDNLQPLGRLRCVLILYDKIRFSDIDHLQTRALFLQKLNDEGNTIVLITSNLGARFLAGQSAPLGFAAGSEAVFEKQAAQAVEEAKKWFRPELVGRLDELIVFRPLSDESMSAIAEKMLCRLEVRAARSGYQLRHTPQVGAVLAARARSAYGARELRRQVDRAVEQALADQIAAGTACTGQHWTADCTAEGTIVLRQDETATL